MHWISSPPHFNFRSVQVLRATYVTSKSLNSFLPNFRQQLDTDLIVRWRWTDNGKKREWNIWSGSGDRKRKGTLIKTIKWLQKKVTRIPKIWKKKNTLFQRHSSHPCYLSFSENQVIVKELWKMPIFQMNEGELLPEKHRNRSNKYFSGKITWKCESTQQIFATDIFHQIPTKSKTKFVSLSANSDVKIFVAASSGRNFASVAVIKASRLGKTVAKCSVRRFFAATGLITRNYIGTFLDRMWPKNRLYDWTNVVNPGLKLLILPGTLTHCHLHLSYQKP